MVSSGYQITAQPYCQRQSEQGESGRFAAIQLMWVAPDHPAAVPGLATTAAAPAIRASAPCSARSNKVGPTSVLHARTIKRPLQAKAAGRFPRPGWPSERNRFWNSSCHQGQKAPAPASRVKPADPRQASSAKGLIRPGSGPRPGSSGGCSGSSSVGRLDQGEQQGGAVEAQFG